jgi:hypothetical protein
MLSYAHSTQINNYFAKEGNRAADAYQNKKSEERTVADLKKKYLEMPCQITPSEF